MSGLFDPPPTLDLKASLKHPFKWALAVGLATALVSLFMPDYYRSDARLLPVDAKGTGGLGSLAATAAAFGVAVPGGEGTDTNFVDILQSRWIKERLLQTEFSFHSRSWRFGADRPSQESLYAYLDMKNMDQAVKGIDTILSANRDLKSKVITISAESKSPELSQDIVQRATNLLNQFVLEKSRTRGSEKAAFAEQRLTDARHKLDQAEAAFRAFMESNRNYKASGDPTVYLEGARLEAELNLRRQLVMTIAINREQALLEAKNDIPILNVLDSANLPEEKNRPHRFMIVVVAMIVTGLLIFGIENHKRIKAFLVNIEN